MNTRYRIKRISLFSALKIGFMASFITGLFVGLIWGSFLSLFSSLLSAFFRLPFSGIGVLSIFVLPAVGGFIWGILGGTITFIVALCYNIAAGIFGGIEVETEIVETTVKKNNDDYKDIYGVI